MSGGGTGIGRATAERPAAGGADVVAHLAAPGAGGATEQILQVDGGALVGRG